MNLKKTGTLISELTRSKDWRISFVPFVMGCVYLWCFHFQLSFSWHHFAVLLLSLLTTMGFASLGYFINELFDISADAKAGKLNRLALLQKNQIVLLGLALLLLTFLPWVYLPKSTFTYYLIAAELACFLFYSLPFIRLKESTYAAGIVDACYAYLVPGLLSYHTFSLLGPNSHNLPTLFFVCIFFIGYRNIFIHQVNDIANDKRAKISTLPQSLGVTKSTLLLRLLFLLELLLVFSFSAQFIVIHRFHLFWLLVVVAYLWYRRVNIKHVFSSSSFTSLSEERHFPDLLYQLWFPLSYLVLAIIVDWRWVIIVPLHYLFLLKYRIIYKLWHFLWVKNLKPALSLLVNYTIYFFFRLFGVNLKKKNLSALEYLKSKFN